MREFETRDYPVFEMFNHQWGLVTAGDAGRWNTCTIAWGSMGSIWGPPNGGRSVITVYVNPDRYTWDVLTKSDTFTVQFFPPEYRKALGYLGTKSGRDGDKIAAAGLTPVFVDDTTAFAEAKLVLVCRKLYRAPLLEEGFLDKSVLEDCYPNRDLHDMYIGEITGIYVKE